MPTIYLKDATFSKLVDSGHYHDYEKVIARGVDLALMEERNGLEKDEELELRQIPKSDPGPLLGPTERSPTSTFTGPAVAMETSDPVTEEEDFPEVEIIEPVEPVLKTVYTCATGRCLNKLPKDRIEAGVVRDQRCDYCGTSSFYAWKLKA